MLSSREINYRFADVFIGSNPYAGVFTRKSTNPKRGLAGPHGYGDLGYDEIEVLRDGLYEHRILFSSGIELQVRFTGFKLWYKDKPA